jgi:hypothetical protein
MHPQLSQPDEYSPRLIVIRCGAARRAVLGRKNEVVIIRVHRFPPPSGKSVEQKLRSFHSRPRQLSFGTILQVEMDKRFPDRNQAAIPQDISPP